MCLYVLLFTCLSNIVFVSLYVQKTDLYQEADDDFPRQTVLINTYVNAVVSS